MSEQEEHEDQVVHEYDDIQEYDNQLPRWWVATFFGTIVFAAIYWFGYHTFQAGNLPNAEFEKIVAVQRAAEAERIKAAGTIDDSSLTLLSKDAATVKKGEDVFKANCVVCHRADGGGNIGPNLTDDAWLHGGKPTDVYKTVNNSEEVFRRVRRYENHDAFVNSGDHPPEWFGAELANVTAQAAAAASSASAASTSASSAAASASTASTAATNASASAASAAASADAVPTITISSSAPSGGSNGDIWFVVP